jgi:TatD DNase family protein
MVLGTTPLFDAHNHLQLPHAQGDPSQLIARAERAGVRAAAVCSTSPDDWGTLASLKAQHPAFVHAQYGFHPWWLTESAASEPYVWTEQLRCALLADPSAGVGETGLDKTRRSSTPLAAQKRACLEHLRIARDLRRPVTLHCVRAYGSLLELLEAFARDECDTGSAPCPALVLHSFRGPADMLPRYARVGCFFSFGGSPLDAAHLELIRSAPRDRLLFETVRPHARLLAMRRSPTAALGRQG